MHYLNDFKGFTYSELNLFKPFTLLIGPNGSGKSNAIEAIEVLSFIAHGRPLHEIVEAGRGNGKLEVRGGLQSCPRFNKMSFTLAFSASMTFEGKRKPYFYSVHIATSPSFQIVGEHLDFSDGTVIFRTLGPRRSVASGDIKVEFNNFARGGQKPSVFVSRNQSILSQYMHFGGKNNQKFDQCMRIVNGTLKYLRSPFVFDPNPKLMRSYERIGSDVLSRDGANLSAVLYSLHVGDNEKQKSLNRLVDWIKQLPDEPYQRIEFITTPLNDVIFGFKEIEDGFFADARLLSDGTLRCLAVLTALETVASNSRVIIEEFDNGLHPSRVKVLLDAIDSCCKRRKLNVFVTTHNPATLNSLKQKQLDGVVLCNWNADDKAFELIRLFDLPRFDELLERGQLGDLVTRRIVEKYLLPNFEEERNAKALDWLQKLP